MLVTSEDTNKATQLIEETIKLTESESDRAYASGLIDMAYELGVITENQKTRYTVLLYKSAQRK